MTHTDLIGRIDAAASGLCPCGAPPAAGSAYCSDDCRPTHISRDTDTRESGYYATPMRWRPDLVTAADEDGLTSLGGRVRSGRFYRETFERDSANMLHLRVDDGHRFVGADVPTDADHEHCDGVWQRLERELSDPRGAMPDDEGPWAEGFSPTARPSVHAFPWRRLCPGCGRHGVPLDGQRITGMPERCQLCEHCHTPFPGPPLTPTVESHGRHTVLRLTYVADGERYTRSAFVTGRDLMSAEDPAALLQTSWDRLEAFLLIPITQPQTQPASLIRPAPAIGE